MGYITGKQTRPRKGWRVAGAAAALLGAAFLLQPNLADAAHGGGGGFHGGGFGGFHGGGFHGSGFGGFHSGGFHASEFGSFNGSGFHTRGVGGFHAGAFHGGHWDDHVNAFRGDVAGLHGGSSTGHGGNWYHGWHNGRYGWWLVGPGLAWTYYEYPWWGYYPDYGYDYDYDYNQPYAGQTWYYCSDPAGYYPYVAQCNTGWQAVPAS
ncbi:MAG: hypothetical protein JO110_13940 [Acetobacteraceae bacterium]|nr:hypothetical protein [Acetobacteraceae bacterium]